MVMNVPGRIRLVLSTLCRVSAVALLTVASTVALQAQQSAAQLEISDSKPVPSLTASLSTATLDLSSTPGLSYSSSSADSVPAAPEPAVDFMQPPPRRRYGRPRYNDNQHNADGSAKWTFELGVGATAPVGNTYHYLNTSYGFQIGGGRNFNKNFGVLMQFDYDRFGFNGRTLYNQQALYNYSCSAAAGTCISDLDGNSHVWSFSLNPVITVPPLGSIGGYVVGGVGFYHKVANFTLPTDACADYYCLYQYTVQANVDHYTSNAPGFNGGIGLTYKASRFSSEHLFVEARYVLMLNSQRDGLTASNINTTAGQAYYNSGGTDYYPANSNRTTYTAYKAGIRF